MRKKASSGSLILGTQTRPLHRGPPRGREAHRHGGPEIDAKSVARRDYGTTGIVKILTSILRACQPTPLLTLPLASASASSSTRQG